MSQDLWGPWLDFNNQVEQDGFSIPLFQRTRIKKYLGEEAYHRACTYWSEKIREYITSGGVADSDFRENVIGYRSSFLDDLFASRGDRRHISHPLSPLKDLMYKDKDINKEVLEGGEKLLGEELEVFKKRVLANLSGDDLYDSIVTSSGGLAAKPSKHILQAVSNMGLPKPKKGYFLEGGLNKGIFTWRIKGRFDDYYHWMTVIFDDGNVILIGSWDGFSPGYSYYNYRSDEANLYLAYAHVSFAKRFISQGLSNAMLDYRRKPDGAIGA